MAGDSVIELIIRLKDEASGAIGQVQSRLDGWHKTLTGGRSVLSEYTRSLVGMFGVYLGAQGLASLAKGFVDTASAMEQYETTLGTVLHSHARAKESLAWIKEFAQTTPYEIPELVEATTRLEAYGLSAQEYLRGLGDTAAAMGKPIMAAVEMIADASQGEFERMKEFGLRASDVAREAGFKSVTEMTSTRDNLIKGTETLMAMLEERYAGGMDKLSKTGKGIWSNLKDELTNFQQWLMGSGPYEVLKEQLHDLKAYIDDLKRTGQLEAWAREGGEAVKDLIEKAAALAKWAWEHREAIGKLVIAYAGFKAGKILLGELFGVASSLLGVLRRISEVKLSNLALLGKAGAAGAAGYLGWKAGEGIQNLLGWGPLYEAQQAEKELEEAKARLAWTQERYNAALEERNKKALEAEAAVAKQTAEEEKLREAQERQVQTLEGELTKAVKTYTDAREKLNKALETALTKELALAQQVAKETGEVGKGVDARILELKRAAAEQVAAGIDPQLVLRAFSSELEKLSAEVQAKATEAWGKWESEGSNAAAATAKNAEDALARIRGLLDAVDLDLRQETATVFGDVQRLVADATAEIEARLRELDAQEANPVIGVVDNATAKIEEIITKLKSIPERINTWVNVYANLPAELGGGGRYVTVTVPSRAAGEWRTTEGLRYVHDDELIAPAPLAGRIRAALSGGTLGGGRSPVNIYITEKLDRQTIRRVLIPEIERAWARA